MTGEYVSIAERAEEGWTLSYATLGIMLVVATGTENCLLKPFQLVASS